jgi:hypothetical protein
MSYYFETRPTYTEVHHSLDIIIADFFDKTKKLPSTTTVLELLEWADQQKNRTERWDGYSRKCDPNN